MSATPSAGLIRDTENYAQTAVALAKLNSYFKEQGWRCREDIPETLLVAYGLVAGLRSRLESPEINTLLEDTSTHFTAILEEDGGIVAGGSLEDL